MEKRHVFVEITESLFIKASCLDCHPKGWLFFNYIKEEITMLLSKIILDQKNYITTSKPLARRIGLERASILSLLISTSEYAEENQSLNGEWFYFTQEKFREFGVKRTTLKNCIKFFEKLGFLETRLFGVPAKTHYKLNHEKISAFLENSFEVAKNDKLDCRKQQSSLSKTTSQFVENSKLDCRKQQTNILYQNTIPENNTRVITAAPKNVDLEIEFLSRIQKLSLELKGEKLSRVGFGNPVLTDIIRFCSENQSGYPPIEFLERKIKAFKESEIPFIVQNKKSFTLHLFRQVWDQLNVSEYAPETQQNQFRATRKGVAIHDLPEIVVTPEQREFTRKKYGTF